MEKVDGSQKFQIFDSFCSFLRKCIFCTLSVAPLPKHIAFIMDGNRRYSKQQNLREGAGHRVGYSALMSMLRYCYELGIEYVTIYAFSIDNFKRNPEEVKSLMDLLLETLEGLMEKQSFANQYGIRVYLIGNLNLLSKSVQLAAERAMDATSRNTKAILSVCIAYTSTDEILHSVEESCQDKWDEIRSSNSTGSEERENPIDVSDIEKHMYMGVVPAPDIIIRTSGETRLSNFLLWQSSSSLLYSPSVLWPDIGFWHLVRAVLDYQRNFSYLSKQKK